MLNEIEKYIARETLVFKGYSQSTVWFYVIWSNRNLTIVWDVIGGCVIDVYGGFEDAEFSFDSYDEQFMTDIIKDYITYSDEIKNVL